MLDNSFSGQFQTNQPLVDPNVPDNASEFSSEFLVPAGSTGVDNDVKVALDINSAAKYLLQWLAGSDFVTTGVGDARTVIINPAKTLLADGGYADTAGDADTVDGKHASEFATSAQGIKADNALPAIMYTAADILIKLQSLATPLALNVNQLNGLASTAFALAVHTHTEAGLVLSNVTTNDSTVAKHGFLPKLDGSTTKFLRADGTWTTVPSVLGIDGREIQLQINGVNLEYRYTGDVSWISLGQVVGSNGVNAYLYIAYASDTIGTGFTLDPVAGVLLPYIAIKNTTVAIPSPVASDFTGTWKYIGPRFGDYGLFTITLPAGGDVATRVAGAVAGVDYPLTWVLAADGINPADLNITHNLNKRIAFCNIYSVSGGVDRILGGTAAYSSLVGTSLNICKIESLATFGSQIRIHLIFS